MHGILVTGCIRSGTTWLGRVLSTARGTVYLHEPMNPGSHWSACMPVPRQHTMLTPATGGLYEALAHRLARLDPAFPSRWTEPAEQRCQQELADQMAAPRNEGVPRDQLRCVWKDPLSLYSAEWLVQVIGLLPVVVLRHPVQVAKSILRLGWSRGHLGYVLRQPQLIKRFHGGDATDKRRLNDKWGELSELQQLCALIQTWLEALAVLHRDHPDWLWVDYHRLVSEPKEGFTELFTRLQIEPTAATYEAVGQGAVGSHDPTLAHQKTLAPIPPSDPLAPGQGVDDWADVHEEWFAPICEELGGAVSW